MDIAELVRSYVETEDLPASCEQRVIQLAEHGRRSSNKGLSDAALYDIVSNLVDRFTRRRHVVLTNLLSALEKDSSLYLVQEEQIYARVVRKRPVQGESRYDAMLETEIYEGSLPYIIPSQEGFLAELMKRARLKNLPDVSERDIADINKSLGDRVEALRNFFCEDGVFFITGRPIRTISFDPLQITWSRQNIKKTRHTIPDHARIPKRVLRRINRPLHDQLSKEGRLDRVTIGAHRRYNGDPLSYFRAHYPSIQTKSQLRKADPALSQALRRYRQLDQAFFC